ncbi:hypothetical protein D3C72_783330 [compost metagenome]
MLLAGARIGMGALGQHGEIEAVSGVGGEREHLPHHRLPLAAVGQHPRLAAPFSPEGIDQQVRHLVGHHLGQKGLLVGLIERRVEAQLPGLQPCRPRRPAPHVAVDLRAREGTAEACLRLHKAGVDPLVQQLEQGSVELGSGGRHRGLVG